MVTFVPVNLFSNGQTRKNNNFNLNATLAHSDLLKKVVCTLEKGDVFAIRPPFKT